MTTLAPFQVIGWFRSQAAEFNQIADRMEATFKDGRHAVPFAPSITPSAAEIREALRTRNFRISGLAKHFSCTEAQIAEVVNNPDNGLSEAKRGWVRSNTP